MTQRTKRNRILRRKLLILQGGVCHYCGKDLILPERVNKVNGELPDNTATLEHLVPYHNRKRVDERDIVLACHECNNRRGDTNYHEFREFRKYVKPSGSKPLTVPLAFFMEACAKS